MILDWRPSFVRGGSGWQQAGLAVVSVGITTSLTLVSPEFILIAVPAVDRTIAISSVDRTITIPDDRTITIPDV